MSQHQRTLTRLTARVQSEIADWIERRDGVRARLHLKKADVLRLLRLRVWGMRYYTGIGEILDFVLPVLRKKVRGRTHGGLGVSVSTLTGVVAEQILKDRLSERYPDNAHIMAWREAERLRQLRAERDEETGGVTVRVKEMPTMLEVGDVAAYSRKYADMVQAARKGNMVPSWRKKRNYRGNPWI